MSINLTDFDIDPIRGFLPSQDPLRRLPADFDAWEDLALNLPKRLMMDDLRGAISRLPDFPTHKLADDRSVRRAMSCLSYLGHAYVWTGDAAQTIPAKLAIPWAAVAEKMGRPPILSYGSYALDNWWRVDSEGPIACGNIGLIQNFWGGADEEWFILIHVDIEARAASGIVAMPDALDAAARRDAPALAVQLGTMVRSLEGMCATMRRMPEWCDPYIYFNRVRPYIHGWKNNPATPNGVVYEGVEQFGGQPQLYRGETGAQSSIVPCYDALLGIYHQDDPLKEYLLEMRQYQSPKHRAFMEVLETRSDVRDFVKSGAGSEVEVLYNRCIDLIREFRAIHLEFAASYIFKQQQQNEKNPAAVGTGGTPFMTYLKKHRDETADHVLAP